MAARQEGVVAVWQLAGAGVGRVTVERQVRERYPVIKRLFVEAGAAAPHQRWSRPDSTQAPSDPR